MTGREYLNEYLKLGRFIQRIPDDIQQARERATRMTTVWSEVKIQSSHDHDHVGEAATEAITLENCLFEKLKDQANRMRVILDVLRSMDLDEQLLIMALYLNGHSTQEYAEEVERTEKWVFRFRKKALDHFDELFVDPNPEVKDSESA